MERTVRSTVAALLLLSAFGPAVAQPLFSGNQDPLAGSRVFGAKGCATCHGINAVGGTIGPDLGRILRPRSFYDLAASMWNHLPRMVERMRQLGISRPQLDPRETGNLIAFLSTLNYFDPPGDPNAGRRLFLEKRCVMCHQVGGTGGVVGPDLDFLKQYGSPIFLATEMWNHTPVMAEAMRAKGIERPTFHGSELLDLIAYLRSASPGPAEEPLYILPGRAAEGQKLFVEKRCIECHSAGGRGGRVGPDLAERGLHRSLIQFAAAMWNKAPLMLEVMKARGISLPLLRAEDMADIVAYLYSVRYFAEPGDPRKGRKLLTGRGCLGCHSVSGKGGKVAGDFARMKALDWPAPIISAMWNHISVMERETERRKVIWPQFRPEEMADLVAFLRALAGSR